MTAGSPTTETMSTVKRALLARQLHERGDARILASEPIAIIGMGCRFPGGANSPEAYWALIRDGLDAVSRIPDDRWDVEDLYDPDPYHPGTMSCRLAGCIDDVAGFDAGFFGISPREAERMDPQQRLVLEVAVEALERAGRPFESLAGSQTGVFVAATAHDYADQLHGVLEDVNAHSLTGTLDCIIANRLSYLFDLRGPSVSIDTACSSSLVAVHLACQSLRTRDSDLALAGGVNAILSPELSVSLAKWGLMAPDGRCKTFDASADGFVRAEGCGIVVLKRLADAIADNDPVLAVIRGTAVNQDGRSTAMSAPNGIAQQDVVRRALRNGGVEPTEVSCIEAHGTGTELGDPIEVEALAEVLGAPGQGAPRVAVTAVKTNIGHLEAAAGIAGLIKLVLCLEHEQISPTIHFERLNPHISLDGTRLFIPTECHPWPSGGQVRIAGVSSFGLGGTNAHVVLEETPALPPPAGAEGPYVVPVSARSPQALPQVAGRLADHIAASSADLADISYTAALRRTHHAERAAVVGATRDDLIERLRMLERGERRPGVVTGRRETAVRRRVAFVFSGQGTQWWAMGRELLATSSVFRDVVEQCDELLRAHVDWSLCDELAAREEESRLDQTEITQPALFAIQVGLAAVWRQLGVTPTAVTGHSVGEVAAAHVCGALGLADALRVVARRGQFMQAATGNGTMASIDRPVGTVAAAIEGYGERISIAAINAPTATVVSGETAAMAELSDALRADGADVRPLPVDYAFHSAQMAPHAEALRAELADLRPGKARLRFVSTAAGAELAGTDLDAGYWARNVREPVRFTDAVDILAELGCDVFVEIGPNPVLGGALAEQLGDGTEAVIVPSLRRGRPEVEAMYTALAQLHCVGVPVDWSSVMPGRRRVEPLPTYPWQHQRYWFAAGQIARRHSRQRDAVHPLLGHRVGSPAVDGASFEAHLEPGRPAFLGDHRIGELALVPAVAFLEIGAAAFAEVAGEPVGVVEAVELHAALALSDDVPTLVRTRVTGGRDELAFEISSARDDGVWTLHATGVARARQGTAGDEDRPDAAPDPVDIGSIRSRLGAPIPADELYSAVAARGSNFGPSFRTVTEVAAGDGEALGRVSAPPEVAADAGTYCFHPALLDGALHPVGVLLPDTATTYLPVAVGAFWLHRPPTAEMWTHVRLWGEPGDTTLTADVVLFGDDGVRVADIAGIRFVRTDLDAVAALVGRAPAAAISPFLEIVWRPVPSAPDAAPARGPWLVVADRSGVGDAIATRLAELGAACTVLAPDVALDADGVAVALDGATEVLYLRALDLDGLEGDADPVAPQERVLTGAIELLRAPAALGVRTWLVTRGAEAVTSPPVAPEQATLSGVGAAVRVERPDLDCVRIDLDPARTTDGAVADLLTAVASVGDEEQVGVRHGIVHAARLVPLAGASPAATGVSRLACVEPGSLDALVQVPAVRRPPGDGEIEIRVLATGLNFRDVLIALGVYPDEVDTFGEECYGEVVSVGDGVDRLRPGDMVIAMGSGSFADYLTTDAHLAVPAPAGLLPEEAATIPITFLTASYALSTLGGLRAGERVLIHAGAGGVGMAAVQIARHLGAEVFATAGSPEKRQRLVDLGVDHVFDSRSLDFADGVLRTTDGHGVDVVLNSLNGDFIPKSFEVLGEGGRFLEIGRREIWSPAQAAAARPDAAYFVVFLGDVSLGDPPALQAMFQDLLPLFAAGSLRPLPVTVFDTDQTVEAFRYMAQARHIGKVVVRRGGAGVRSDGTYLVTGGLGGIGRLLARRLVELGARHVALAGRSDPDAGAQAVIDDLVALGVDVRAFRADVSRRDDVERLLADIDATMPTLRGIVHAAGVNQDAVLTDQSWNHVAHTLGPKLAGTWNLHRGTQDRDLDLFAMMSTAAAVVGGAAQVNYAASNAFLDAFAGWRRAGAGPTISIGWGPWDRVGMTARLETEDVARMRRRGIVPMPVDASLDAFARLVGARDVPAHTVVMVLDPDSTDDRPLLSELRTATTSASAALLDDWIEAVPGMRRHAIAAFIVEEASKVLGLPAGTPIGARQPFHELGLDSLMAVELRNAIGAAVGRPQPATLLFDHPTTDSLVDHLLDVVRAAEAAHRPDEPGGADGASDRPRGDDTDARRVDDLKIVAELSEEEAEALLLAELGEIGETT